jgi:hypothetical protein
VRLFAISAGRLLRVGALAAALAAAGVAQADTFTGTEGDDLLRGGPGADVLLGLGGNDRLAGGGDADVLDGGSGSDDLAGGRGRDAVVYPIAGPIVVTLDDLANDGPAGSWDNVQTDVEDVFGTPAGDRLAGSAGDESLDGGGGDDLLEGGGGEDALFAGDGDDRVEARDDRRDKVACGQGFDIAIVDDHDRLSGCEIVDRRPAVPRVDATVAFEWQLIGNRTVFPRLVLSDVDPARAAIELRCSGLGCPFARRAVTARSRVLTKHVRELRAAPGARLEVRLTAPGRLGKLIRFEARSGKAPVRTEQPLRATPP